MDPQLSSSVNAKVKTAVALQWNPIPVPATDFLKNLAHGRYYLINGQKKAAATLTGTLDEQSNQIKWSITADQRFLPDFVGLPPIEDKDAERVKRALLLVQQKFFEWNASIQDRKEFEKVKLESERIKIKESLACIREDILRDISHLLLLTFDSFAKDFTFELVGSTTCRESLSSIMLNENKKKSEDQQSAETDKLFNWNSISGGDFLENLPKGQYYLMNSKAISSEGKYSWATLTGCLDERINKVRWYIRTDKRFRCDSVGELLTLQDANARLGFLTIQFKLSLYNAQLKDLVDLEGLLGESSDLALMVRKRFLRQISDLISVGFDSFAVDKSFDLISNFGLNHAQRFVFEHNLIPDQQKTSLMKGNAVQDETRFPEVCTIDEDGDAAHVQQPVVAVSHKRMEWMDCSSPTAKENELPVVANVDAATSTPVVLPVSSEIKSFSQNIRLQEFSIVGTRLETELSENEMFSLWEKYYKSQRSQKTRTQEMEIVIE